MAYRVSPYYRKMNDTVSLEFCVIFHNVGKMLLFWFTKKDLLKVTKDHSLLLIRYLGTYWGLSKTGEIVQNFDVCIYRGVGAVRND